MSDDIFIKHGLGTFQQPYNARQPVIAQEPNIRNTQEPNIRNAQEPNIRSQQEPNIRPARQPLTYDHRSPFTYDHRSPSTYQHRSPGISRASYQARQPATYDHRSPSTYRHPIIYQHPSTYNHRIPYIASARAPTIKSAQEPNIRGAQQPTIKSAQQPNIKSAQEPNIAQGRQPTIKSGQEPNIGQGRQPVTYARQGQTPTTYQHRSPFTYDHRSPFTYNHRSPFTYDHRSPLTYNASGTKPFNWVDDITHVYGQAIDFVMDDTSNSYVRIRVTCKYVSGRLEAWVKTIAHRDHAGALTSSHSTLTRAFYVNSSDHTLAGDGAYTVKFTQTTPQETGTYGTFNTDGDDNASTITASATTVPATVDTKYFEWEVTAESEESGGEPTVERADFSLNLIFEHSSLPTITYVCDWSLRAEANGESSA